MTRAEAYAAGQSDGLHNKPAQVASAMLAAFMHKCNSPRAEQ